MKLPKLYLFVEDFSGKTNEAFFEREIPYLLNRFEEITVIPLFAGNNSLVLENDRVKVVQFDLFSGINRIKVLLSNLRLVTKIFSYELRHTHSKTFYLKNFFSLLSSLLMRIASAKRLGDFIKNDNQSALFYTYWFNQWTLTLSIIKDKFPHLKLVSRMHGKDYDETQVNSILPFRYYQLDKVNGVFAASDYGRKYLQDNFKFKRATTAHLGLNNRNELAPIDPNVLHLVSCSAVIPLKRVHLIIEILKQIEIPVRWTHFGNGSAFEDLKARVKTLPPNVEADLKGYVFNGGIFEYFAGTPVSFFIHVTETEGGVPVSISEAASFGVPIIGTAVCGVPEIVNEQTGFLIPLHFAAKEVAHLIVSEHKLGNIYKAAFRTGVQHFYLNNYYAPKNYSELANNLNSLMNS